MKRALAVLAAVAFVAVPVSNANFNAQSANSLSVQLRSTNEFLKLLSDAADTSPLTGYADKRQSSPAVKAATGADDALVVSLGGFKNTNVTPVPQVLTLEAASPLPGGITSITVSGALVADAGGKQPLTAFSFTPVGGGATTSTVTLTAGQKAWLNVSASMKGAPFPGNNLLYTPYVRLTVNYTGYTGTFFSYRVPMRIWDGNGAGP